MTTKAKISLSQVKEHNISLRQNNGVSTFKTEDVAEAIISDQDSFMKDVHEMRSLSRKHPKTGKSLPPVTNSFTEFISDRYGINATKEELAADPFCIFRSYLKQMGVETHRFTLSDMSEHMGNGTLSLGDVESLLSTDIKTGTTFIIREVFTEAIRLGMMGNVQHPGWIMRTVPLADLEATSPQIKRGNARVKFLEELESIEYGTVSFGQKKIKVRKIGTGLELSDEVIMRSSIDMLVEYVMTVGEDMGLGADALGIDVLKNGEQADLSESAPIIGSESGTAIAWKDMMRVVGRMRRLGSVPDVIITQEGQGLDLSLIDELKGFDGVRMLSSLNGIFSNYPNFQHDIHGLVTSGTAIFLSSKRCMLKHTFRPMKTEKRRNPKIQADEIYFTDWIGFSIVRRDARVIVDKATAYSGAGFPSYMDVDAYQNNPFNQD